MRTLSARDQQEQQRDHAPRRTAPAACCRAIEPLSEKYSMRMCRSRATAAEPATRASTIIRKTENSSVQAKDESVK